MVWDNLAMLEQLKNLAFFILVADYLLKHFVFIAFIPHFLAI